MCQQIDHWPWQDPLRGPGSSCQVAVRNVPNLEARATWHRVGHQSDCRKPSAPTPDRQEPGRPRACLCLVSCIPSFSRILAFDCFAFAVLCIFVFVGCGRRALFFVSALIVPRQRGRTISQSRASGATRASSQFPNTHIPQRPIDQQPQSCPFIQHPMPSMT